MGAVHFYHLTSSPLERALPKLLERSYAGGFRTVVTVASAAQAEKLDALLWTYDPDSFLPHGREDSSETPQPVLLAEKIPEVKNEKEILFITDGRLAKNAAPYARVIDMFDGSNPETLAAARTRWKQYKNSGCELYYYQQTSSGSWDKKAD